MTGLVQVLLVFAFLTVGDVMSGTVRDSNVYMDAVINNYLRPELRSLDPKTLPNFATSFKTSTLRVNVHANYTRGELRGMSSVKRIGDCHAPKWEVGSPVIRCVVTFNELDVKYDLSGKYGILPTVSGATARAKVKDTTITLEVSTGQQRNYPYLKSMSVGHLGKVKPSYSGISTLNSAESSLKHDFQQKLSPLIISVLNNDFRNKMAFSVNKLTMPLP